MSWLRLMKYVDIKDNRIQGRLVCQLQIVGGMFVPPHYLLLCKYSVNHIVSEVKKIASSFHLAMTGEEVKGKRDGWISEI